MDLESIGYRKFQLEQEDLNQFRDFFQSEIWTPDPDQDYKAIPAWANRSLVAPVGSKNQETYESCSDRNCPSKYKEWAFRMIQKYAPEARSVAAIDRLGITIWNGAANTGWHTDNDGSSVGDEYVILFYHVPQRLSLEDGATLSIAQKSARGRIEMETIVPFDGTAVIMKIDNDKFEHKASPLVNLAKDRFTLMVGIMPPWSENKKQYYRSKPNEHSTPD
jgi:hypothetical protein